MAPLAKPPSNIERRRKNARAEGWETYARKRAELASIAASLFRERGYDQTTLADIAERAGLDRATVYYYVGSKQELFQTSIEGVLDDNVAIGERLVADGVRAPRERLCELVTAVMVSYATNYPQMYVYIQEQMHRVAKDPSKWAKEIQRKTRHFEGLVRELIEQAVASGDFRQDIDPQVATRALFGMLNWTHRWFQPNRGLSAPALAEQFCTLFLDGMSR